MAARTPRRSFATPFVITLAAAPACYVQSTPAQQPQTTTATTTTPPPATNTPTQSPAEKPPVVVVANPPRPQPNQATTPNTKWTVSKTGTTCDARIVLPAGSCPPKAICNPPRPQVYECPTEIDLGQTGPLTVASSSDGLTCMVEWGPVNCPAGASCNPPPPVSVPCPKP